MFTYLSLRVGRWKDQGRDDGKYQLFYGRLLFCETPLCMRLWKSRSTGSRTDSASRVNGCENKLRQFLINSLSMRNSSSLKSSGLRKRSEYSMYTAIVKIKMTKMIKPETNLPPPSCRSIMQNWKKASAKMALRQALCISLPELSISLLYRFSSKWQSTENFIIK
jgi:hypothetical protein